MIENFVDLVLLAYEKQVIKKLVFSKPKTSEIKKISGRLCSHRGRSIMAFELSMPGDTVSHKNVGASELPAYVSELLGEYSQANLITTLGDAERKLGKRGEVILGGDALMRKLSGTGKAFELAIEELDRKKSYILSGSESFLVALGISDKTGRVHDKRQAKFRQINRFLEHIEDIYPKLPTGAGLTVYDLCSGKSYLSFAAYYYLTEIKKRAVNMLSVDLKRDVISWCEDLSKKLGFDGMRFMCEDIRKLPKKERVDMVISLHACDIATDIVIDSAMELGAAVILSTPCCHRYLSDRISSPALSFVSEHSKLRDKLSEAITDALRLLRMQSHGYDARALELTDPENTPKNTLLCAIKRNKSEAQINESRARYNEALSFVLGDKKDEYLKDI